jgi:DNA-binding transcriptional MerR regulator
MNASAEIPHSLQRFTPDPDAVYPIDTIAHLADVPRHTVLLCCRHGLIAPEIDPDYGGYSFHVGTIPTLQQVNFLHYECGINFAGIRIILGLMEELDRLRERVRDW